MRKVDRFPGNVTAGLRVARLGTTSVRYDVGLFREDDDEAAAFGHFVHVCVDRATRLRLCPRNCAQYSNL